ncbi:CHASE2 domain-containing protein [Rhodopseudomonas sp. RCAM05734]|uniref:CHASE2 domain-containing protein n=1 Tax=Rhodopseudomonas sp. RCAM05734 TaxID=3457549 RepID=UPI004044934B
MKARAFQAPVAIVLAGLWGAALTWGNGPSGMRLLDRFEATLTDLRVLARGTRLPPDAVTIVAIDDQVVREQGSYPLPRAALARIIEQIAQLKPRVIAVDLLLVDRSTPEDDAALARALGNTNAVIAAAAIFAESRQRLAADGDGPLARLPTAARFLLPLKDFTDQAGVGVVNVTTDQTGIPRSIPLLFRTADAVLVSLPLRTAAAAARQDPSIAPNDFVLSGPDVPTDVGHLLPISFYGPHGTIPTVGASAALDGTLARHDIEDRAVVIGVTATGGGDFFPTPFDPVMPGVEVVATAITHLLAKDALVRNHAVRLADGAVAVLLPMLLVGLLAWRRNTVGLVAIAAVAAIWSTVNVAAFAHGVWLSAALPIAAAAPPTILFGAVQIWMGRRRAQHLADRSDLLQQFQAPRLHAWLTEDPDFLLQPVHQDAAIVFIDLSGFTAHSETAGPNATRELLSDFQRIVDREVEACGGLITSFMGDGAMILFGLPQASADDAVNAVNCCLGLSARTHAWLASLPPQVGSRIGFKIGAHFGAIVASRLGGSHQHVTAIGDTVNVASRMMDVAKSHGAEIALTDDLLRKAGPNSPVQTSGVLNGPEDVQVRGRTGSINVWLWRRGAPTQ